MQNKNIRLTYLALGSFILILLNTSIVQNSLSFFHYIGLHLLGDTLSLLTNFLSFAGAILFIFSAIKLILNNIKEQIN